MLTGSSARRGRCIVAFGVLDWGAGVTGEQGQPDAPQLAAQWARIRGRLQQEVGEVEYRTWLRQMSLVGLVADEITVNLPTRDPDKAIRLMAYTAMHQSEIKARAGGRTRGRKLADPVYCYSLSWAPGEEP